MCVKGRFKGQFYTLLETQFSNHWIRAHPRAKIEVDT